MLARREIYIIAGVVYFLPSDPKQTKCCNLVLLTSPGSCFPWKHVHLVLTLLHFETAVSILFLLFKKSKKALSISPRAIQQDSFLYTVLPNISPNNEQHKGQGLVLVK